MIGKIIPQCELLRLYISVRDISLPGKFLYRSLVFLREINRDIRTISKGSKEKMAMKLFRATIFK